MTIVNDMWIKKVWNNPGGVPYNVGYAAAPRSWVRTDRWGSTWPAPVYGANSQQWLYGRGNYGNINSNYNVRRKITGMWNYIGNGSAYQPNYGYNYNGGYNGGYNNDGGMSNRMYGTNVLDRAVTDANAWYQWSPREREQIRRAAQNNPSYAQQLLNNYKNTGSFWDNSKSADYGVPRIDNNGNYVRENFRNPWRPRRIQSSWRR